MFQVTGVIMGETETIRYDWEDGTGKIEGGPAVMFLMRNALERKTAVGPVGQPLKRDLDEPLAALFMIRECFDEITACEGEIPQADELPEDVIG